MEGLLSTGPTLSSFLADWSWIHSQSKLVDSNFIESLQVSQQSAVRKITILEKKIGNFHYLIIYIQAWILQLVEFGVPLSLRQLFWNFIETLQVSQQSTLPKISILERKEKSSPR